MKLLAPTDIARVETAVRATDRLYLEPTQEWGTFDLINGIVGLGTYASAMARALPESAGDELADAALARAVELFDQAGAGPSLHNGIAGLGQWVAATFDADDLLESIDTALLAYLERDDPRLSLRAGVAGLAIYVATRRATPAGRRLADDISRIFAERAIADSGGITWPTPPAYAVRRGVAVLDTPIFEPGMCHGQGGILVGLTALAMAGDDRAADLIAPALDWLWSVARPGPDRYGWIRFGSATGDCLEDLNAETWCTGDPGVARAAWLAARAIGRDDHAGRALDVARDVADRVLAGSAAGLPHRADLCCGAASVGHIFHLMFADTAEPRFHSAALATLTPLIDRLPAVASFQFGRTGVLAALLSATTDAALDWDVPFGMAPVFPLPRVSGDTRGQHS